MLFNLEENRITKYQLILAPGVISYVMLRHLLNAIPLLLNK